MRGATVRNAIIILALAAIGTVWQRGLSGTEVGLAQLVSVLFVAAMVGFGIRYFRERPLAWLVMRPWQRAVVVGCAVAAAGLAIIGFWLLDSRISALGVLALIAALLLVIVWVVRESQRYR